MKILVIGESCIDNFIYGKSERLSPEAPVPVFIPCEQVTNYGMAHNVYNNLLKMTHSNHVEVFISNQFATKTRYVEKKSNHCFLRVDIGDDKYERIILKNCLKQIKLANCIIISDYNKGFLFASDICKIRELNKKAVIFLDTKKLLTPEIYNAVDYIKLNESEHIKNEAFLNGNKVIVTLGERGAMHKGKIFPIKNSLKTIDVSGAGDTFIAGLAYKFMQNFNINLAIKYANECAIKVVSKRGVTTI
jgi:D-beta-D-heptose 7-phosphate kinase/D-beta-D-heptose 1-phosphate adenosyltransferase